MSAEQETQSTTQTPPADTGTPPASADQVQASATDDNRERDEKGRFRNPLQPRIDELTRQRHDASREAGYWKQRAEAAEQKAAPPPPQKPTPEQFDDYGAYVEALADWKADEKVDKKLAERDQTEAATRQHQSRMTNWEKSVEAAKAKHTDYESVMAASEVPVAQHVTDLLLDSDMGAELAYHLDRNPSVAERLNKLSPTQAAKELGKLEVQLGVSAPPVAEDSPDDNVDGAKPPVKETPPPKPKTSAAPAPVKPSGSGRNTTVPLDKLPMDEYVRRRVSEGAKWARR